MAASFAGRRDGDLLALVEPGPSGFERLAEGAAVLRGFSLSLAPELLATVLEVARAAPFRHMVTPGGYRMSVAMTNCGTAGWVTDRRGYRYDDRDPVSGQPWPSMPRLFQNLATRAAEAAGFSGFVPDACLINRYEPGTRLSLHQDVEERDFGQPIVSVSLGLSATFLFGGPRRSDPPRRVRLESGDMVVWGGPSRRFFHGIAPLKKVEDPLAGPYRFNLTLRKAR